MENQSIPKGRYVFLGYDDSVISVVYGCHGEMKPDCEAAWELWESLGYLPQVFLLEERALDCPDPENEWIKEKSKKHNIPIEYPIIDPFSENGFKIVEEKFPEEKQKYVELAILEFLNVYFHLLKKLGKGPSLVLDEKFDSYFPHISKSELEKAKQAIGLKPNTIHYVDEIRQLRYRKDYCDLDFKVMKELYKVSGKNVDRVLKKYDLAFAVVGFMHPKKPRIKT